MKVIDLLNKIAKGEIPKKIKYYGYVFEYDTNHLRYESYFDEQIWTLNDFVNVNDSLNDEVEIIEDTPKEEIQVLSRWWPPKEDNKIEKLDLSDWWEITSAEDCKPEKLAIIFNKNAKAFSSKINELIDKVNGE